MITFPSNLGDPSCTEIPTTFELTVNTLSSSRTCSDQSASIHLARTPAQAALLSGKLLNSTDTKMYVLVPSTKKSPPPLRCPAPMSSRHPHQEEFFYFLDLPPEIRNHIYEYIFADSTTTIQTPAHGKQPLIKHTISDNVDRFGLPALLEANRQIGSEAIGVFYANTTIVANDSQRLIAFLKGVEKKHRKGIKSVQVEAYLPDERDLSSTRLEVYLERIKGYLSFSLRYTDLWMGDCEMEARIVSRETGRVLWPRDKTKGK